MKARQPTDSHDSIMQDRSNPVGKMRGSKMKGKGSLSTVLSEGKAPKESSRSGGMPRVSTGMMRGMINSKKKG
jgi:hypothetical protein